MGSVLAKAVHCIKLDYGCIHLIGKLILVKLKSPLIIFFPAVYGAKNNTERTHKISGICEKGGELLRLMAAANLHLH